MLQYLSHPTSWLGWRLLKLRSLTHEQHFADDIFKRIFFNENVKISIRISLNFVPKGPINNNPALVQIMAWRRSGDKPLSEPMMVSLLTHICVTRPQWVNCSVSTIFELVKVSVRFFESHSYLTGVTAAELQQHLSKTKLIFNSYIMCV